MTHKRKLPTMIARRWERVGRRANHADGTAELNMAIDVNTVRGLRWSNKLHMRSLNAFRERSSDDPLRPDQAPSESTNHCAESFFLKCLPCQMLQTNIKGTAVRILR